MMGVKKVDKKVKKVKETIPNDLTKMRDLLIKDLQNVLLSQSELKKGGAGIKERYAKEIGYVTVVDEINCSGKKLGLPVVTLGKLRRL